MKFETNNLNNNTNPSARAGVTHGQFLSAI